jgi:voltage-gated potassium channel
MRNEFEVRLARRASRVLKMGTCVILASTTLYYLTGCLCGMNAGFGKRLGSLEDDRWEVTECIYASLITLTTVGYTDLLGTELVEVWRDDAGRYRWVSNTDPHQDPGFDVSSASPYVDFSPFVRIVTAFQSIVGVAFFLYVIAQLTSFFVEGDYEVLRQGRRVRKRLARLSDHMIVCGGDVVTEGIVHQLTSSDVPCAVIEESLELSQEFQSAFPRVPCLRTDSSQPESIITAGVARARGLFTAHSDDRRNLVDIVTARQLNPDLRIISRCMTRTGGERLKYAGADGVVCTPLIAGMRLASELARPTVVEHLDIFLRQGGMDILQTADVDVGLNPRVRRLNEVLCGGSALRLACLAISRGDNTVYNPAADTPLYSRDKLRVMGSHSEIERLQQVLSETATDSSPQDRGPAPALEPPDATRPADSTAESSNRYIVCGPGETGLHVISELLACGRSCAVIERDSARSAELQAAFPALHVITGDADDPHKLREAGIEHARGLALLLPSDRDNLVAAVTARQINERPRIVVQANHDASVDRLKKAGCRVQIRGGTGGARMAAEMLRPGVSSFLDRMLSSPYAYRFEAVVCREGSPYADQAISQAQIRSDTGLRIAALRRPGETDFIPAPQDEIMTAGTVLIVVGLYHQVDRLAELAGDWD